jgi:hypothetical protein
MVLVVDDMVTYLRDRQIEGYWSVKLLVLRRCTNAAGKASRSSPVVWLFHHCNGNQRPRRGEELT